MYLILNNYLSLKLSTKAHINIVFYKLLISGCMNLLSLPECIKKLIVIIQYCHPFLANLYSRCVKRTNIYLSSIEVNSSCVLFQVLCIWRVLNKQIVISQTYYLKYETIKCNEKSEYSFKSPFVHYFVLDLLNNPTVYIALYC